MAREVESLVLQMSADIRRMEKALDQGQKKFDRTANAIERRQKELDRSLATMGREAANFAAPIQAASGVALGAIVGFSINAAKRAEAVNGAFEQTFRAMPAEANKSVSAISNDFQRLETDLKDRFTQMQSVLVALGVNADQSLKVVDALSRRSLDIAAFKDVDDARAFQAVISGITGETEPLKAFGIVVSETAVKAELLRLGFKGNAEQASEGAKAIARANIILARSKEMHGQVARESETLSEQQKRTNTTFTQAAEVFGQQFLPIAKDVLLWASDALKAFNDLPSGVQNASLAFLGMVAASGPIAAVVTGLKAIIGAAIAARGAMAAIGNGGKGGGGTGLAEGAVGGALGSAATRGRLGALLAGGARVAGPVGVLTTTLSLGGDTSRDRLSGQQRINAQLAEEARLTGEIARLRSAGNEAEARRQEQYQARVRSSREMNQGLLRGQALAVSVAQDASAAREIAKHGDFGLSDAQKMGTGGAGGGRKGGGRKASGPTAEELAAQRTMLALQGQIEVLRAQGRDAEAAAIERQVDILNLTKQYADAGVKDAAKAAADQVNAVANAEAAAKGREAAAERAQFFIEAANDGLRLQNEQMIDRLAYEAELARLSGDPRRIEQAERTLWIEEQINQLLSQRPDLTRATARPIAERRAGEMEAAGRSGELRDASREAARDFVNVLSADNIWEAAGQRFKEAAWDGVEDLIAQLFGSMGNRQGQGGGNWMSAIASFFTGGRKRATGGAVTAGYPVLTGERRPEIFVPHTNGTVIPSLNAAMARVQGGAQHTLNTTIKIDLTGANGDATIRQIAYDAAARGAATAYSRASQDIPAQGARRARQQFVR